MTLLTPPAKYDPDTRRLAGPKGTRLVSKKRHLVLMLLIRRRGQFVDKDALIAAMYPMQDEPEDPYSNLRTAIFNLRHILRATGAQDGILTTYGSGYVLRAEGA